MSDAQTPEPAAPSLQERMLENIKQAHDLIMKLQEEVNDASAKVASETADSEAAAPLSDQIIEKLSTIRVDGELIIAPHLKDDYRDAMNSKEGMADLMNQLTDIVQSRGEGSKTASALGEAAAVPNPYGDSDPASTGFGALPSRIRM